MGHNQSEEYQTRKTLADRRKEYSKQINSQNIVPNTQYVSPRPKISSLSPITARQRAEEFAKNIKRPKLRTLSTSIDDLRPLSPPR